MENFLLKIEPSDIKAGLYSPSPAPAPAARARSPRPHHADEEYNYRATTSLIIFVFSIHVYFPFSIFLKHLAAQLSICWMLFLPSFLTNFNALYFCYCWSFSPLLEQFIIGERPSSNCYSIIENFTFARMIRCLFW